jgi:hypothetical protein
MDGRAKMEGWNKGGKGGRLRVLRTFYLRERISHHTKLRVGVQITTHTIAQEVNK